MEEKGSKYFKKYLCWFMTHKDVSMPEIYNHNIDS